MFNSKNFETFGSQIKKCLLYFSFNLASHPPLTAQTNKLCILIAKQDKLDYRLQHYCTVSRAYMKVCNKDVKRSIHPEAEVIKIRCFEPTSENHENLRHVYLNGNQDFLRHNHYCR